MIGHVNLLGKIFCYTAIRCKNSFPPQRSADPPKAETPLRRCPARFAVDAVIRIYSGGEAMSRIFVAITICVILAGCQSAQLKEGGLYLNKSTCVGMDDFGVAKVRNQF